MSATSPTLERRTLDRVTVGEALPELAQEVSATTVVLGALAARDWRPMHHDFKFATERNGLPDIFLSTPNNAAWFERYLSDWTGPYGRLGRITFRMKASVFAGDTMVFRGTVTKVEVDETGCGWVSLDVTVSVGDRVCTTCAARIALPTSPDDNPWTRRGPRWKP
jgi:acyl dehydratase